MHEIGYRTTIFDDEWIGTAHRDYLAWLLGAVAAKSVKVRELLKKDASILSRTPL